MTARRRGEDTKERILEEACKVFAGKGYRDATHAEICRRANINVAAINYYFSSKESLYRAVFDHLTRKMELLYPLDGGMPASSPPEKRLHAFILAFLRRMFDPEHLGSLHRIRMAEMFDPTNLLEDLLASHLARDRNHIQTILRELLGPQASQRDVEWCEMSIVGQCFSAAPGPGDKGPRELFNLTVTEVAILAHHILSFSLAGVTAIRQRSSESSKTGYNSIGKTK